MGGGVLGMLVAACLELRNLLRQRLDRRLLQLYEPPYRWRSGYPPLPERIRPIYCAYLTENSVQATIPPIQTNLLHTHIVEVTRSPDARA